MHVICGNWQLLPCRCCARFPLMATWLSENRAGRSGCTAGCPTEATWRGNTEATSCFALEWAWPTKVWTGSLPRLYCFQSCTVADSANVQVHWKCRLREPRWNKWLWRSRMWRKQRQGCSPVELVGNQSNTCSYWSLVRPQRADLPASSTSFLLFNQVFMVTAQSPPAPPPSSSWAAAPSSSVRWKGPARNLRCSGGSQMGVCTKGQRSLSWNQWPIQMRAPGTARSPTKGSCTARACISQWQVGRRPLPNICNRRAAADPNHLFFFQNRRRPWRPPGRAARSRLAKTVGSPLVCLVHTDGADCRLDVLLTILLSSGGLEQVGPARPRRRRCCGWDSAGGCGSWSQSAAWLLLSWWSSSFTCTREFKTRK